MNRSTLHNLLLACLTAGALSSHAASPMDTAYSDKCNLSATKMCNIDTILTDTNWHWVFSDSTDATKPAASANLSAWLPQNGNWSVRYANTDSVELATNGSSPVGGKNNTMLIWPYKMNDGSIQIDMRMPPGGINSGLQWHSWCNTNLPSAGGAFTGTDGLWNGCGPTKYVNGPQMDQGQNYDGDMYYTAPSGGSILNSTRQITGNAYGTVIVANSTGCRAFAYAAPPAWIRERVRFHGDTAWTYLGVAGNPTTKTQPGAKDSLCNEIVFNATGASAGMAPGTTAASQLAWQSAPGIFAWQYESATIVEWKNVKVKNLDTGLTGSSAILLPGAAGSGALSSYFTPMDHQSLSFNLSKAGNYSVQIADLKGNVIRELRGSGPVSGQNVSLGASGIFIIKTSLSGLNSYQKVYVP